MKEFNQPKAKGVTLIELLVALSVLAILVAFASPSLQDTAAKASMREATEQVALALRTAKNSARINNASVTVTLTTDEANNTISFAFPNDSNTADSGQTLPQVILPPDITVSSDTPAFVFSPLGMVNTTGSISLASTENEEFSSTVAINSLMGHVTAHYDSGDDEEEETS
jgi:type IV fimbrial biogenesis protein FimT